MFGAFFVDLAEKLLESNNVIIYILQCVGQYSTVKYAYFMCLDCMNNLDLYGKYY